MATQQSTQVPDRVLTDGVITLRKPVPADAPVVAAAIQKSLDHLMPWMPWAGPDYDESSAMEWISNIHDPAAHNFAVTGPDGSFIGSAGVNRIDGLNQLADVGYWLLESATGQGFATRATVLLLRYAIEDVGLHRAEVVMSSQNEPSRRVAERAIEICTGKPASEFLEGTLRGSMKLRGEHHDAHVYAITRPDLLPA